MIESHPVLDDGQPFPTLFWLTCPVLAKRAARLESTGWMTDISERLAHEPSLRDRFTRSLARYRARRDARQVIEDAGSPPGGGPERVKCVHAHLAHHLADPANVVGAMALADAGWPDCREPCFQVRGA